MTIGKILDHLIDEVDKAIKDLHFNKPISYALYQTWKWCDEREKNRNEKGESK